MNFASEPGATGDDCNGVPAAVSSVARPVTCAAAPRSVTEKYVPETMYAGFVLTFPTADGGGVNGAAADTRARGEADGVGCGNTSTPIAAAASESAFRTSRRIVKCRGASTWGAAIIVTPFGLYAAASQGVPRESTSRTVPLCALAL